MKVFVTGITGLVGTVTARYLHEAGHEVIGFSRNYKEIPGMAEFRRGTVTDYDTLKKAMEGCDAVVHLAALHMPYDAPEQELYHINCGGTFNIFKACSEIGIRKITVASSPNAIGYNFGTKGFDMAYLPVDGNHPSFTTDPYSYSKETIESIGRYFYRRYGISSVFMRLGLNFTLTVEEWAKKENVLSDLRQLRKIVDALLEMPEKDALQEVRLIENSINRKRREAMNCGVPFKNGTEYVYDKYSEEQRIWNYYVHNFLMFLDKRDLGEAILTSVEKDYAEGSWPIFVADHKNMLGIQAAKIAGILYPGAKLDHERLQGYDAVVDYRETEKLLGWKAKHTAADFYDEIYK